MQRSTLFYAVSLVSMVLGACDEEAIDAAEVPTSSRRAAPTENVDEDEEEEEDDDEDGAKDQAASSEADAKWAAEYFSGEPYSVVFHRIVLRPLEGSSEPQDVDVDIYLEPKLAAECDLQPALRFETDSAKVAGKKAAKLDALASCLKGSALEGSDVFVVGFTDPRGTKRYNRDLGMERAKAVRAAMVESGVDEARITTESNGEQLASNDPEDWAQDRRVVVRLAADG